MKSFIKKKIYELFRIGRNFNTLSLSANSKLDPNVTLRSSVLEGTVCIANGSNISETVVKGQINIESDCQISLSKLDGDFKIGRNCKISELQAVGDVYLDENVSISYSTVLNGKIKIGAFTSLTGPGIDFFTLVNDIQIGRFCSIARHVTIQEASHHTNRLSTSFINSKLLKNNIKDYHSKGSVIIGNDVWIGTHAVILTGVTIGDGAIIGANSLVNNDVPPYAIVGGSPAKVISYRFEPEIIDKLLSLKWWEWSIDKIKENEALFSSKLDLTLLSN